MELRHSFRGNRQHHRNGNCRVSGHDHDHGRSDGIQWSGQLQRRAHRHGSGGGTGGGSGGSILSLTIIPSGIVFGTLGDSGQFLAIGTFSTAPTVRDLTNSVTWLTSEPNKFPVTNYGNGAPGGGTQNGGVVSAYEASVGNVGATITAEATDSNGSIATATANVGCPFVLPNPPTTPGSCFNFVPQLLSER